MSSVHGSSVVTVIDLNSSEMAKAIFPDGAAIYLPFEFPRHDKSLGNGISRLCCFASCMAVKRTVEDPSP